MVCNLEIWKARSAILFFQISRLQTTFGISFFLENFLPIYIPKWNHKKSKKLSATLRSGNQGPPSCFSRSQGCRQLFGFLFFWKIFHQYIYQNEIIKNLKSCLQPWDLEIKVRHLGFPDLKVAENFLDFFLFGKFSTNIYIKMKS